MKLIALGHVALDHLLLLESWPAPDTKLAALRGRECTGGPAARAALTAAALGVEVSIAGCVGADAAGERVRADLRAAGVDNEGLLTLAGHATARASIWVESKGGKRTVVLDRGGLPPFPEDALEHLTWTPGLLLLDGKEPAGAQAARRAQEAGMELMLDLGGPREDPWPLVEAAQVAVVSKAFVMHALPGMDLLAAARRLAEGGPRLAVITLGAGGVIACERAGGQAYAPVGTSFWFPAWNPGKVVDTTGAGDVYHGTLAWALLQGWETRRALACAAVAGGLACLELGGEVPGLSAAMLLERVEAAGDLQALGA